MVAGYFPNIFMFLYNPDFLGKEHIWIAKALETRDNVSLKRVLENWPPGAISLHACWDLTQVLSSNKEWFHGVLRRVYTYKYVPRGRLSQDFQATDCWFPQARGSERIRVIMRFKLSVSSKSNLFTGLKI